MNLLGLDLTYAPNKEQKATTEVAPSPLPSQQMTFTIDRDFLLMLAVLIVLSGALVMVSGMALAHVTRS
jgi:hypothetical protein